MLKPFEIIELEFYLLEIWVKRKEKFMKTIKKKIPKFKSVDEEIEFWDKNEAPDFFNFQNQKEIKWIKIKQKI